MTDLLLSNSKVKTWRRCPNQYRYKYVERLRGRGKKVQLEMGSWIHDCLMTHYDGEDWREVHEENKEAFFELYEEHREMLGDLPTDCERILESYFRHYKELDSRFKTVDSEMDEVLELPNGLRFRFIIDQIVEDENGWLWLRDHKTGKGFFDHDFMILDAQLSRYFWCAEKMGYTPLAGIEFNEIRTKAPVIPKLTEKTGQLERRKNMDTDYWTYLREVKRHGFDPKDYMTMLRHLHAQKDKFFRRSQLPQDKPMLRTMMRELVESAEEIITAERKGRFPRSPSKNCKWDCDFVDLCTTELQGGDPASIIRHNYRRDKTPKE